MQLPQLFHGFLANLMAIPLQLSMPFCLSTTKELFPEASGPRGIRTGFAFAFEFRLHRSNPQCTPFLLFPSPYSFSAHIQNSTASVRREENDLRQQEKQFECLSVLFIAKAVHFNFQQNAPIYSETLWRLVYHGNFGGECLDKTR